MSLKNIGPIERADIDLGDLTVLIGPQASGKTTFLQFLRLVLDYRYIVSDLKARGFDWGKDTRKFLESYLGEGMSGVWSSSSSLRFDNVKKSLQSLCGKVHSDSARAFYIPAQRVITIEDGWPKIFTDFGVDYPYSVKEFSHQLRQIMEQYGSASFPKKGRLPKSLRDSLRREIFRNFTIHLETQGLRKTLLLSQKGQTGIPIMAWSTGQREFTPFMLALDFLAPSGRVTSRDSYQTVLIEEPEMGLHPNAIWSVMLGILELLKRGYRIVLSTHSVTVLDVIWTLQEIKASGISAKKGMRLFRELFHIETAKGGWPGDLAKVCLQKKYKTFYFDLQGEKHKSIARDISGLDPASEEDFVSEWGQITSLSSRAQEIVTKAYR